MASYKCITIAIVAICLCFCHASSSQDTVVKGKQECSEAIHNTTDDLRRVLKGGGAGGGHGSGGGHAFSGGARGSSSGRGYSSDNGYSSTSTVPVGAVAAGAAAGRHGNSNHHAKSNGFSTRMGSDSPVVALLTMFVYSFVIISLVSWI